MATNNAVNVGLAGSTGTGSFVGSNAPTLLDPVSNKITFNDNTKGIVGTTTNDNAAAGYVGEFISSNIPTATVTLADTVIADITSISLTAGDWDLWGNVIFTPDSGATLIVGVAGGISSTSATFDPDAAGGARFDIGANFIANTSPTFCGLFRRYSLSAPTTIYLVVKCDFSVDGVKAGGFIGARRIR